jgi:D-alanine transaminase
MWVQGLRPTDPALKAAGVKVITLPDERWARCHLKTISLLANVLAKDEAKQRGAFEAFLVRDGLVTEGTSCNAFFVRGETLVTAQADNRILNGITRVHLLELAKGLGIPAEERDIPVAELAAMNESFVTSTLMEVMPVASIDGKPLGDSTPGAVTQRLADALSAHIAAG